MALISGEAGIGKSAIAAAIGREAELAGAAVTRGRAWEFADAPPYFPVWGCLRGLGVSTGTAEGRGEAEDGVHTFHLWEAVVTALARLSASAPVVWILEDLHAADLGTLDLLTFLAQPLQAMRVLIVATVRSEEARVTERVLQRLTRMARDGLDVRLEPLNAPDIAALAEATVGHRVPADELLRLREVTGGNPLFVIECARALRLGSGGQGNLPALPPTVRRVVLDRLALLAKPTRDALAAGAVLGREFSAALVARMADSLPAPIIHALLPALRAGVIGETKPGHYTFSHALVREAIEDALGADERAASHARAAAALAHIGETADILLERARHALLALPFGGDVHALALLTRATDILERDNAFDRAFDLHSRIGDARKAGLLPAASGAMQLHVAWVARAAGRAEVSRRLCAEVVAYARAQNDGELLARAALLYGADLRPGVIDRSLVTLLQEARAALGPSAPGLEARLLARLAAALQPAIEPKAPMAMARDAIRRAYETRDDCVILEVLELAGAALVDYAPVEERIDLSAELLMRALRVGDRPKALRAYARLAFDHLERGDFEAFDRHTEGMLALSEELGHPRHRWRALLIASARAVTLGYFAESDRYVTEAERLAALTDDPAIALSLVAHDVLRARTTRRDEALRARLAKLESEMNGVPEAPLIAAVVRATCFARLEDVDAVRKELTFIGARAAMLDSDPTFLTFMAESYALAGTDDERRRVRGLLALAPTNDRTSGHVPTTYEGTVPRLLGLLDAALGDLAGAEGHLRKAHALAVARRHAPWIAQTLYELAKVVRLAGREHEARVLTNECSLIARGLGMKGLEGSAATACESDTLVVSCEGEVWQIVKGSVRVRVRDSRGIRLLAKLVERAGEELHVLALASDEAGTTLAELSFEVLDVGARKAYRKRLSDLDAAIGEAERNMDATSGARLQREREALARELASATGLGGRSRNFSSATERARVNVQRRVRDAIERITEANETLGRFFETSVRTGTYCSFVPDGASRGAMERSVP